MELNAQQRSWLLEHATEHTFPPGHVIVRQEESGGNAYAILSGRVRVVESVPDSPVEMFLGELAAGEIFGELGVLRDRPRSASIVTLERTRVLAIRAADFRELLKKSGNMSLALLRILAGRLYDADRLLARHAPDPLTGLPGTAGIPRVVPTADSGFQTTWNECASAGARRVSPQRYQRQIRILRRRRRLRTVADALVECRDTDIVARYGGDELQYSSWTLPRKMSQSLSTASGKNSSS